MATTANASKLSLPITMLLSITLPLLAAAVGYGKLQNQIQIDEIKIDKHIDKNQETLDKINELKVDIAVVKEWVEEQKKLQQRKP